MTSSPEVSVVIPFYNEEHNVLPLFAELSPILADLGKSFEVVAVDDGSSDGTSDGLAEAVRRFPGVRHIRLTRNSGQTAAFEAGFRAARGAVIATMDGDLQIDPRDLPAMLRLREEAKVDFVYGWRKDRQDDFLKRVSTKIANAVRNWLTRERINDTGCPLKVFRREILDRMKLFNGMHRFFITLAHLDGYRSAELIVHHRPRIHGKSKYGVRNRVLRALRDCLVVRWMMSRHLRYEAREVGVAPTVAPGVVAEATTAEESAS